MVHFTSADYMPPGLRATATRNSVTLSWEDPEDSAITGYRILRSVDWGRETTLARSVSGAATSYVDRLVSASTAYAYRESRPRTEPPASPVHLCLLFSLSITAQAR